MNFPFVMMQLGICRTAKLVNFMWIGSLFGLRIGIFANPIMIKWRDSSLRIECEWTEASQIRASSF